VRRASSPNSAVVATRAGQHDLPRAAAAGLARVGETRGREAVTRDAAELIVGRGIERLGCLVAVVGGVVALVVPIAVIAFAITITTHRARHTIHTTREFVVSA
jgi:hypothetical protein